MAGDEGDEPADEDRDGGIERRHGEARHEQRDHQPPGLAGIMPVEGAEPGRRRPFGRNLRRFQQMLESSE